jgi:hypothetical protein
MYWYYFQSARGVRIWRKKYITMLQIIQFVIHLGFVYFASYTYFSSTYFPWAPNMGKCAGEEFAAFAGIGILSSYLLLFISFYFATYKEGAEAGQDRSSAKEQPLYRSFQTHWHGALARLSKQEDGLYICPNPPLAVYMPGLINSLCQHHCDLHRRLALQNTGCTNKYGTASVPALAIVGGNFGSDSESPIGEKGSITHLKGANVAHTRPIVA